MVEMGLIMELGTMAELVLVDTVELVLIVLMVHLQEVQLHQQVVEEVLVVGILQHGAYQQVVE